MTAWVIRVGPRRRSASRNVRYASDCNRIDASRRNDAMCQNRTHARSKEMHVHPYSITSSARASSVQQ